MKKYAFNPVCVLKVRKLNACPFPKDEIFDSFKQAKKAYLDYLRTEKRKINDLIKEAKDLDITDIK